MVSTYTMDDLILGRVPETDRIRTTLDLLQGPCGILELRAIIRRMDLLSPEVARALYLHPVMDIPSRMNLAWATVRGGNLRGFLETISGEFFSPEDLKLITAVGRFWSTAEMETIGDVVSQALTLSASGQEIFCGLLKGDEWIEPDRREQRARELLQAAQQLQ